MDNIKTIAIYRMPNERDYYSHTSEDELLINSKSDSGFYFSDFETNTIYSLKNSKVNKNSWPEFNSNFKSADKEILKEDYLEKVSQIIEEIKSGKKKKVVFSRIKNHQKPNDFDLKTIFDDLCESYPKAFVYCISSQKTGTWIGASPELLLNKSKDTFKTVALAGTRTNPIDWTNKEREEQQVVTDYLVEKISPHTTHLNVSKPYDLDTGAVIHLKSDLEFKLAATTNLWDLVSLIHPTPAVCGIPTQEAKKLIQQLEPHNRNLYTGFIGPMGINTHSSLFVNLRCMQICKDTISLYVGGGIMGNSSAEKEWIETENKAKTLNKVI